jgi:signal transduction histidine kinase/CheY-like chemotaxis protein/methyl-accepting chemotaxis protein
MKIYQKFITAFSLVALIIAFLGFIATQTFQQMSNQVTVLNEDIVPGAVSLLETTATMAMLGIEINEFLVSNELKHLEQAKQFIVKMQNNVEQHTAHETHLGEQARKVAQDMENRTKAIIALAERAFNLPKMENKQTEVETLQRQMHVKIEALRTIFAKHVALHNEELNATLVELNNLRVNGTYIVWIATLSAMLLLIALGIGLSRAITRPITHLSQIFQAIAAGHLSHEIRSGGKDEIGQLLQVVDRALSNLREMVQDIVQVSQGLAEGHLQIRPQVEYRGDFTQIKHAQELALSNQQQVIKDIVQVSQGLAAGNLQVMPQVEYRGDFLQIKTALETAANYFQTVIVDLVQISEQLAAGSLQVSHQVEYRGDFMPIKEALEAALSDQRQVIEDMVQVSQGLAEGNLQVMPQVNYRGDFLQIKTALETAANYFQTVIVDLVQIAEQLAAGSLQVIPQVEYRGDFLPIKDALEIALSDQRQVIEDIVQVSQGLADGNLQVMPQVNYRGDFMQIKTALETALTGLRQVIADIVQMSQGVAEGQRITSQVEYRGDFAQTQQALETASLRLAETMKQNATQDWLKTGQNQLNDQMSGEQNMVELTHNLVSFLTLYLEAQVGVCYLVEGTVEHKYSMKLIASYAQTRRKNLAEEFQFSEGLVERAAKELNSILIKIEAGLEAETVPPHVVVIPFLYENAIKGVIVLGSLDKLTEIQQEFLHQVMPSVGIAVNSVESRTKMQALLQQTQAQSEELQNQQQALQQTNEELQSQSEELQSQTEELQTQQEELQQSNDILEERTKALESQKAEIQHKNLALEKTRAEMEKAQVVIKRKAEELQLASKYKSEFLANMSHELRTPLNSLLILAQLLAENKPGNLTDKQREYAQTIHNAGSDLLTLINEILDLSKVEAGKIEVHIEDVSLADLIATFEQKFRHVAEEKALAFNISVANDLPTQLETDAQRFQQIINNLLSNAFKFTSQGEVRLKIHYSSEKSALVQPEKLPSLLQSASAVLSEREDGDNLLAPPKIIAFSVTDTGAGIPKDKQKVIFEAFQQVDGTTSRRYGGTGLGLSISRQLARLLGGELQLQSEERHGSCFTLYLPEHFAKPEPSELPRSEAPLVSQPDEVITAIKTSTPDEPSKIAEPLSPISDDRNLITPEDKIILIIEDDRKFSRLLMELAQEKAFKCLVAEDGQTGLQLANEYKPHAIILDVGLPLLDGWIVMDRLKENPATRHIPVHFISGAEQSLTAKKMGAIGYLHKPVSVEQLGDTFKKIEQFITRTVKNLLVVVDSEPRQQQILELVGGENIQIKLAMSKSEAFQQLQMVTFDCIILDMDIEQTSGSQLLKQMQQEKDLCQMPVIIYAERDLTSSEETLLLQCAEHIPVKSVRSPERLLDEATLFLHQLEAKLPVEKRNMLRMVHDKEAILKQKKVLIVDDDVRNLFALTTVLEDHDMEVLCTKNGKEGLKALEEHHDIALVLMDIMMPEMDGYETMREIRKHPQYRQLPIIALTAKAMKGDKAKCIEAGANDYLSKPVDTDKLISLMRVWLYR